MDGDYRLKAASPAIDAGSSTALPADGLDLDADGNTTEPLPFDLDNEARIESTRVDMGAYEQLAKKPTVTPTANLTVSVGDGFLTLTPDPNAPSSSNTYIGSVEVSIDLNFQGRLGVTVTSQSAAGGRWSGWVIPDTIGPGEAIVTLWVKGREPEPGGAARRLAGGVGGRGGLFRGAPSIVQQFNDPKPAKMMTMGPAAATTAGRTLSFIPEKREQK